MIQVKHYQVNQVENLTIALFADIHYSQSFPCKRFAEIIACIEKQKPDYICVVGDVLDQGNTLQTVSKKPLFDFLEILGKICPVLIGIGNHDQAIEHNKQISYYYDEKGFEELNKIPNVFVLNNQVYQDEHVCILGYTLSFEYYYNVPHEDAQKCKDDLDVKLWKLTNPNRLNILLCHSPLYGLNSSLTNSKVLKQMDLILSGHMHSGLVPPIFDRLPGNYGFVSPYQHWITKYARGIIKQGTQKPRYYIINGGILKFSEVSPKFLHPWNLLFPGEVNFIFLKNEN